MNLFKIYEKDQYQFYQIPQELFTIPKYKSLSTDAKVLYSILLDRMHLSEKNEWVNDKGEIYLIYSRENVQELLCISAPTCTKAFKELNQVELIKEVRRGLGKPNHIYVAHMEYDQAKKPKKSLKKVIKKIEKKEVESIDTREVVQNERILKSRPKNSLSQDLKNLSANKTNINKTNINKDDDSIRLGSDLLAKENIVEKQEEVKEHIYNLIFSSKAFEKAVEILGAKSSADYSLEKAVDKIYNLLKKGIGVPKPVEYFNTVVESTLQYNLDLEEEVKEVNKKKPSIKKKKAPVENSMKKLTKFDNFEAREYDYEKLEKKLLGWDKE
ncbi:replication initiator protein A [Clostridium sp.]|uniref:replication initiator protein A n=1 Tax=Clostridium sp. TaxID=1506 RepID=UPI00284A7574|nr:replication initiator protein A [Clostridium sp.]MDR3598498.1 replication initiator protein A [Clostridium sp.]